MDEPPEQPFREFARELLLRFDRSLRRFDAQSERRHAEAMAHIAELRAKSDELIEASRVERGALLAILDRLDGGGGAASA
jgi:hypothetical protein